VSPPPGSHVCELPEIRPSSSTASPTGGASSSSEAPWEQRRGLAPAASQLQPERKARPAQRRSGSASLRREEQAALEPLPPPSSSIHRRFRHSGHIPSRGRGWHAGAEEACLCCLLSCSRRRARGGDKEHEEKWREAIATVVRGCRRRRSSGWRSRRISRLTRHQGLAAEPCSSVIGCEWEGRAQGAPPRGELELRHEPASSGSVLELRRGPA
jgi:hypothetical protein